MEIEGANVVENVGTDAVPAHNAYHRLCLQSVQRGALWAALAGLELMAFRADLKHGEWCGWVSRNCEFSHPTALSYIGAAQRAIAGLGAAAHVSPREMESGQFEALKARLVELLEGDHLAEKRAALIAAIKPAPTPKPQSLPKLARKKALRPTGPRPLTAKAVPVLVSRVRIAAPEVQRALFEEFRPEIKAWLQTTTTT